jgi:bidirectional [NiFe] hydrogenase diaphorase subunit
VDGLSPHGGCRLCLVEIEGSNRLQPACFMKVNEGMVVRTDTDRLREYRRMIIELLFAEGNHICAVCVANNNCELQDAAVATGMDHERLEYQYPKAEVDISHDRFGIDHSRWAGRGAGAKVIIDLDQPWGDSQTCTSCGKCFMACPTGAIFRKGSTVSEMDHGRAKLDFLITAREKKQWNV